MNLFRSASLIAALALMAVAAPAASAASGGVVLAPKRITTDNGPTAVVGVSNGSATWMYGKESFKLRTRFAARVPGRVAVYASVVYSCEGTGNRKRVKQGFSNGPRAVHPGRIYSMAAPALTVSCPLIEGRQMGIHVHGIRVGHIFQSLAGVRTDASARLGHS